MSLSRRKQEDQNLKVLKSIQQIDTNKRCFECDQRGPTYVDVTIGSFVCTSCGGILRGINPPHRVKSISMATFTAVELALIQKRGNEYCAKVYLGKYDERSKAKPESRGDISKLRMFMEEKYEKKRWYVSPELVEENREKAAESKPEPAKPASAVVANTPNVQPTVKPVEPQSRPQKPTVDNILGDFASFDLDTSTQPSDTTNSSSFAFADFGSAFSQPAAKSVSSPFDAFGDFNSGANNIPSSQQIAAAPQSNSFQASFPPMTTTTASVPPPAPKADKYADLGDLFSMDNAQAVTSVKQPTPSNNTLWGSVFMTPVSENQSKGNSAGSVFGMPKTGSVFENPGGATFNNNAASTAQPFGNMSQKPADNFSMPNAPPQQNAGFGMVPSNQQMYASNSQQSGGFAYMTTNTQAGFVSTPPSQPQMHSNIQGGGAGFGIPNQSAFVVQQQPQIAQNPAAAATQQMLARQQQSASPYMNMTSTQTPAAAAPVSNPFFQPQAAAASMPSNSNPFMAAQPNAWPQQGAPTGATNQVSANNPFMTQTPSMPVQQASTNPFF